MVIPKFLRLILVILGPAAVMTAGIMGAGSTTSLLLSGSYFGYRLLWVVILTLPMVVICLESSSRVGIMAGGKGWMNVIKDQIHPFVAWIFLFPIVFSGFFPMMGQIGVMKHAFCTIIGQESPGAILDISVTIGVMLFTFITAIFGGYKMIEKIMAFILFLITLCFFAVTAQHLFNLGEFGKILTGIVPNVPLDVTASDGAVREGIHYIAGITGGAVAPMCVFSFAYYAIDAKYGKRDIIPGFKKAILTLGLMFGFYSLLVLVAGGGILHNSEYPYDIVKAAEASMVLRPVLGGWAVIVFCIGLFACGYSTAIAIAQMSSYLILDTFGKNWSFTPENKLFNIIFILIIFFPGMLSLLWTQSPLLLVVLAMVFNAIILPLSLIVELYLVNKKNIMGEFKAGLVRNIIIFSTLLLSVWICIRGLSSALTKLSVFFG